MNELTELQRLDAIGHGQSHPIPGFCDVILVRCILPASHVLARVQSVLRPIFQHQHQPALSNEQWKTLLPAWFVDSLEYPGNDTHAIVDGWDLEGWLYWYVAERQWWWWDAEVTSDDELEIVIDRHGEPAVWGDLRLLLCLSGAADAEIA